MSIRNAKRKLALSAAAATAAVCLASTPALADVTSYYWTTSPTYSHAEIYVDNGTQGLAWALHGNLYVSSGWWTYYAWATAQGSATSNYGAGVQWR